jgi:hypothetical protein
MDLPESRARACFRANLHGSLALLTAISLASSSARADGPTASEATADALFVEAKGLMMDGEDAAACPKLAESQRLDPGTGTLLMLALCHERIGRTASAWGEYREALARAEREHRSDRSELARKHVASLEARLARVRVRVAEEDASLPGFEVRRDGEPMGSATWLVPIPIDPGVHQFEAFALGERLWSTSLTVGNEPGDQEVFVPKLRAPSASPPPSVAAAPHREREPLAMIVPAAPAETSHPLRIAGIGAAVLAVAGVVVGSVYGVYAISDRRDAERLCPAYPCAPGASDANESAKTAALISDVAFAAGGAGALGSILFFVVDGRGTTGPVSGQAPAPNGGARSVAGFTLGWQGRW